MTTVGISYAEGWDAATRRAHRPLSTAGAGRRDTAGEPYVEIHRQPGRAEPVEVYLVAWADGHVGHWMYDELGRRTREFDLRLLEPDRLFIREVVERRYSSPDQPDRARDAWLTRLTLTPGKKAKHVVQEQGELGSSRHGWSDLPEAQWWIPRAAFGVGATDDQDDSPAPGPDEPEPESESESEPESESECVDASEPDDAPEPPASLWRPPRPRRLEFDVQELFQPGNRFGHDDWGELTVDRVEDVTTVRVPSGRLVVADPLYPAAPRELTQPIPPGEYRLQTPVPVGEGDYHGEGFPVEEEPLLRLLISDEPAASWEMGLGAGEDPRLLLDGEAYGFVTDAAHGAFADAAGWDPLSGTFRRYYDGEGEHGVEEVRTGTMRVADRKSGGDLVTFCTCGDGAWSVWLGRSASGDVVSVVVLTDWLSDYLPL
ncbi:DUF4241 domain-containing protein [Streptomyces sp. NPDC048282]|uniref:DUF4241 domain-containing protein n=1 Tax=Streptomyces sp. NPDC048282 TaxID=3365528 RepID=UPI00371D0B27